MSNIHIPIAPLLAYIERLGGVSNLPGFGIPVEIEIESHPYIRVKMDRTWDETRRYARARKALYRLTESAVGGMVDYFAVDSFVVTHLGTHPCDVYGSDWYSFEPATELEDEPMAERERELRVVA